MADFHCPLCNKPLARRARKDGSGYFWSCTGYPECKFAADDYREAPFLAKCTECGKFLSKRISKTTQKPYTACLNSEGHESGKPIFYNDDGTPRGEKRVPKVKGKFTCPECGAELKAFFKKNGPRAGEVAWACHNKEGHEDGQSKYWHDNSGRPLI